MKKQSAMLRYEFIILFSVMMFLTTVYGLDEFEFRHGIKWGMSAWQVKNIETGQFEKSYRNYIIYQDSAASHNSKIWYEFQDKALSEISCFLQIEYTDNNKYITEYNRIRKMLSERYGAEIVVNEKWSSDKYKKYKSKKAIALAEGELEYLTVWRLESIDTGIMLHMAGNGEDNISISIIYSRLSAKDKYDFDNGL